MFLTKQSNLQRLQLTLQPSRLVKKKTLLVRHTPRLEIKVQGDCPSIAATTTLTKLHIGERSGVRPPGDKQLPRGCFKSLTIIKESKLNREIMFHSK